mgnify:CR=1 FL=1
MPTVYAVTSGSYSDYRVDALYSTREKAEQAIALSTNPYGYDIEDYELDPANAEVKEGWELYSVVLWTSMVQGVDSMTKVNPVSRGPGGIHEDRTPDDPCYFATWVGWAHNTSRLLGYRFGCNVYADSPERAIKVTNERHIMAVANGELAAFEKQHGINQG